MHACLCRGITESDVQRLGRTGITDAEGLIAALALNAEDCCGRCLRRIEDFVDLAATGAAQGAVRLGAGARPGAARLALPVPPPSRAAMPMLSGGFSEGR